MTKKNDKFVKTTSRRTGKIITVAFFSLILAGGIWFYLAYQETQNSNEALENFRLMPCEDMKSALKVIEDTETNQYVIDAYRMALIDKQDAGNCDE